MVRLSVRVRPSARRSTVVGYDGSVLKADVAAPAAENRANEELIRLLAKELGVGRTRLVIVRGQAARDKIVEIDLPRETVESWLAGHGPTCNPTTPSR